MTAAWTRETPLAHPPARDRREVWRRTGPGGGARAFPVDVRVGKPFDVVGMKGLDPAGHRRAAAGLDRDAAGLYGPGRPRAPRTACPCCGAPAGGAEVAAAVRGAQYLRCPGCGHGYVGAPPDAAAFAAHLACSEDLAGAYTDPAAAERRIAQVVAPKLAWAREVARRAGAEPRSVLDVGAGAGHFVAACRRAGLAAEGIEVSGPACRFAAEHLGVALRHDDVLSAPADGPGFDLVTLWGVLEYAPEPVALLAAAGRFLAPGGLVVVEVPRIDALGSAVQRQVPDMVVRHLEPGSHLNVFSDASACTALWRAGLGPLAAWYFGMDAYELLAQAAVAAADADALAPVAGLLLGLQPALDAAALCDDLVLAAVPLDRA